MATLHAHGSAHPLVKPFVYREQPIRKKAQREHKNKADRLQLLQQSPGMNPYSPFKGTLGVK